MITMIFRQQGIRDRLRRPGQNSTIRNFSSPATTRSPKPIVTPKVGAVVSRRQWEKFCKPPPRQAPSKDSSDDKPWPRSMQIAGYTAAATLVPYCIAWFIATNAAVRSALFPYFPGMENFLRNWFGSPEEHFFSYVDYRQERDKLQVPRTLNNEYPFKVRKEQAELQKLIQENLVPVRIRVFTHDGFNLGEVMQVPGDTPVNKDTLLKELMSGRSLTIDPDSVAYVAVDFKDMETPSEKQEGSDTKTAQEATLSVHVPFEEDGSLDLSSSHLSELIKSTNIYSKWHYQPSAPLSQQQTKVNQDYRKLSEEDMQVAELEFALSQLEKQLKDHTTMRSFDDIKDEIRQTKSELRKLKWKRRLRLFD